MNSSPLHPVSRALPPPSCCRNAFARRRRPIVAGYKALVCVFLFGGNDSHNIVVPITYSEYNAYSAARGGPAENNGLALPKASLLPLSGNNFGLHPALPNTAALYNAGKAAVVANTGVLLAPTTLAQYNNKSVPLPPQLFSHSDMQSHWQTMRADQPAETGWGGRWPTYSRARRPAACRCR